MRWAFPVKPDWFWQAWYKPTIAAVLEKRTESMILIGAGLLQVSLHLLGLPGWACPFKQLFGIPCPGCGLTNAVGQLLHGEIRESLHTHPFAPIFLTAFLLMGAVVLLPKIDHDLIVSRIARFESKTGLAGWVLAALICYWFIRLLGLV